MHRLTINSKTMVSFFLTLREKCPNTEFFLVRIFPHSDWIRRDTPYLSYAARMRENTDQKKLRIRSLFMQCHFQNLVTDLSIFSHPNDPLAPVILIFYIFSIGYSIIRLHKTNFPVFFIKNNYYYGKHTMTILL